ncbi:phage tail protein [Komagataeibacter nataicola]|uniref:Phage tail protein n=1 Tax=Komagataeibacter nataicola TaxID=265960 RepID=A0A9N7CJJ7_9PROT|nr:phage tail protein [Komagataeibacter nataicola]AQU86378.1 phage tail protein [Komagataeibacter nataicola]PYD64897.1 phage tail protein [Komagataeibacter nataicola]WEQ56737.1 phage tail protein [Komagataeibacter nataicola]GBR23890.1 phage tail sheath protein [Komagataeibacter nataicola NRIC 0616]
MTIYQSGQLNTNSLSVPDLYVQILKPQTLALNGVATGRIGLVGTAAWGPVASPVIIGSMGDCLSAFGPKQAQANDIGTAVNIAILQGASDFRCVRVSDGTDGAATGTLAGVTLTAIHTGSAGNALVATMAQDPIITSNYTLTVTHPVLGSRTYRGSTWPVLAAAIAADGTALVRATVPTPVPAPEAGSATLAGGSDGGVPTTAQFLGTDGTNRTGMYALRGQGCAIGLLHGMVDNTSWTTQAAFGLGEGMYMIACGPAGDTIANAVAMKNAAGLDSYAVKLMFGDWLWWDDDTNGDILVPPQAFAAGILGGLSPEQSSLNKELYGVIGSQKAGLASSGQAATYSGAELSALFTAGIDVICNPAPGGSYWAVRGGINTSADDVTDDDTYTRLTNYIAETLNAGMGAFVGAVICATLYGDIRAVLLGTLSNMVGSGILGASTDYAVLCDTTNNPQSRTALGYVRADVQVRYQGINRFFVVNLQGGASVTVSTTTAAA